MSIPSKSNAFCRGPTGTQLNELAALSHQVCNQSTLLPTPKCFHQTLFRATCAHAFQLATHMLVIIGNSAGSPRRPKVLSLAKGLQGVCMEPAAQACYRMRASSNGAVRDSICPVCDVLLRHGC
eukprot:scaffold77779_cov22-Tisochrysis_lutea.AAC.1